METLKEKPLREEVVKLEIELRRGKDREKLLQQLKQTLREFGIDNYSLERIPIFFEKKWDIPESTFVSLSVPKDTCTKLSRWRRNNDSLIIDASNGELLVLNETKLDEWRSKQNEREQDQTKASSKDKTRSSRS